MDKIPERSQISKGSIPKSESIAQILLGIMLFSCLLKFPYGYYQLMRFLSAIIFLYLGIKAGERLENGKKYFFLSLALLFQPIFKITLRRSIWMAVDIIAGIMLWFDIAKRNAKIRDILIRKGK